MAPPSLSFDDCSSTSDEEDDVKRLTKFASSYYDKEQKSDLIFVKNHSSNTKHNHQEDDTRTTRTTSPDTSSSSSPPSTYYPNNAPIQLFIETPIICCYNDLETKDFNKFCIRSNSVSKNWKLELGGTSHHPLKIINQSSKSDHHHHASTHFVAEYRIPLHPHENQRRNRSIQAGLMIPSFYHKNKMPFIFFSSYSPFLKFHSPKWNLTNTIHLLAPSQPTYLPSLGTEFTISTSSWDRTNVPTSSPTASPKDTCSATQFQAQLTLFGATSPFLYYRNENDLLDTDMSTIDPSPPPIRLTVTSRQWFPSVHNGWDTIVSLTCGFLGSSSLESSKHYCNWLFPSFIFSLDIRPHTVPHQWKLGIVTSLTQLQWIFQYSRTGSGLVVRIPITLLDLVTDATTTPSTTLLTTKLLYSILPTAYMTLVTTILHDILVDYFYSISTTTNQNYLVPLTFHNHKKTDKTKEEANRQILLLTKSAMANRKLEEHKSLGLCIEEAWYYNSTNREEEEENRHDVTIPLQFWVSDSVLKLPLGSKSSMLGFYDMSTCSSHEGTEENTTSSSLFGRWISTSFLLRFQTKTVSPQPTTNKHGSTTSLVKLFVRYKHGGIEDTITINDDEELSIP